MKKVIVPIIAAAVSLTMIIELVRGSSGGISGRTSSPSETTCNTSGCHTGNALNTGGGTISITSDMPGWIYSPGVKYSISVTVSKIATPLFGFGFEALTSANANAGTFTITDASSTQLLTATNGRKNVVHKKNGGLTANTKTFTFDWTAPTTNVGTITFYTAGNAANNNGSTSGDFIYTATQAATPRANEITTGPIAGNPFCEGQTGLSIPFTAAGFYTSGNVFTAQLSDAAGSFATPTAIGSITGIVSDTIISTIGLPGISGTGYRIRVISNNPATTGTDNGTDLTINQKPTQADAGPDQFVCDTTATLSANSPTNGSGKWRLINGTGTIVDSTNATTVVNGLGVGQNFFEWVISNGLCADSHDTVIITRRDSVSIANAGTDQIACADSIKLAADTPTVGTGTWVLVSGTGIFNDPNSPASTVSGLSAGVNIFAWTISNSPCPSSSDTVAIDRSGIITVPDAGPGQELCASTATLDGNSADNGTGVWTLVSGSGTIIAPADSNTTVTGLGVGENIFRWTISNAPCTPLFDDVIIKVSATPTVANAGADQTICSATASLSANVPTVGTGSWTIITGAGAFSNINSPFSHVTNVGNGENIYRWTISNAPCDSTSDDVKITNCTLSVITAQPVSGSPFCSTTSYNVSVFYSASANLTGNFRAELSDSTGSFANPIIIGVNSGNPIAAVIPASSKEGTRYRIRVVNIDSGTVGSDNGSDLSINTCKAIFTDSIAGSPFCSNTSYDVSVPFSTLGNFTGAFTAQLSDVSGSFNSPLNIGYSSNSPISATIPSGVATGTNYRIRVINSNSGINGSPNNNNLSINVCGGVGIFEVSRESSFSLYPNPNNGAFTLLIDLNQPELLNIDVVDILGNTVSKKSVNILSANEKIEFNLNELSAGIYYVKIQSSGKLIVLKLLKR